MAKKRPKPKSKASSAEVFLRVEEILRIRLDSAQFHDVAEYAKEKGWNVSLRQLARYIRKADELLVERNERSRRRLIARHIAQREGIAARSINSADWRAALAALDSNARLQGLFTDQRDLKELVKLAESQGEQLRQLQERIDVAQHSKPSSPAPEENRPLEGRDEGAH